MKQLFDGYIICFGTHRWYSHHMTYADITQLEIEHFRKLGLMLGYIPVREWTGDPVKNRRDLVWLITDSVAKPRVFLHLERETQDNQALNCISNKDNKLLNSALIPNDGRYLMGVFGWITTNNWAACCDFVKTNPGYKGKNVLLIGGIGTSNDKVRAIEAMIWSNNIAYTREAEFSRDAGGFWCSNFTSVWR